MNTLENWQIKDFMARMKVLLTQDVPGLGTAGAVLQRLVVTHGINLMPCSMAILATKGALKQAEEIEAGRDPVFEPRNVPTPLPRPK